jgi:hypothetical protein
MGADSGSKQLEMLHELVPASKVMALLIDLPLSISSRWS